MSHSLGPAIWLYTHDNEDKCYYPNSYTLKQKKAIATVIRLMQIKRDIDSFEEWQEDPGFNTEE